MKMSIDQFVARIIELRDGCSPIIAAARNDMLFEKLWDSENRPEEARIEMREALKRPCIPTEVAELEARRLAALSPEKGAAALGELLGARAEDLERAKDAALDPLEVKDYQRFATKQVDGYRRASKGVRGSYNRDFFWFNGRHMYAVSLARDFSEVEDEAYVRGLESYTRDSSVDKDARERIWALASAPSTRDQMHAFARWYEQACPVIHLHRPDYTASLATTGLTEEEPVLPWRCVLVELPKDVVPTGTSSVRSILTHRFKFPDGRMIWNIFIYPYDEAVPVTWSHGYEWATWSAEDPETESSFADPTLMLDGDQRLEDFDQRCMTICRRIVAGVCHAMSSKDDCKPTKSAQIRSEVSKARLRDQPACRVYILGRPVKVDCRIAVKQYVEHGAAEGRGPLTLQLLVRGHWRRQAIGSGRGERKWIRIEPYWKGPEDAPVRVRPRKM